MNKSSFRETMNESLAGKPRVMSSGSEPHYDVPPLLRSDLLGANECNVADLRAWTPREFLHRPLQKARDCFNELAAQFDLEEKTTS